MASKSTEKKTSLEPSEIFCALGLFITDAEIDDLCKDNTCLLYTSDAADE